MANACETDKTLGHHPDDPQQCISYQQFVFVAVLRAGNETELKRLSQLLHNPGPFIECLRWNGEKLTREQYTEVLALDPFINWMRNNLIDSINCDGGISIIEESNDGDMVI